MNDVYFIETPLHFVIYAIISKFFYFLNFRGMLHEIFLVLMSEFGRTRSLKSQVKHTPTWRKFTNLENLNL